MDEDMKRKKELLSLYVYDIDDELGDYSISRTLDEESEEVASLKKEWLDMEMKMDLPLEKRMYWKGCFICFTIVSEDGKRRKCILFSPIHKEPLCFFTMMRKNWTSM